MANRRHRSFLAACLVWFPLALAFSLALAVNAFAEIVRDGSLGTNATPIVGPNYTILPDHGKQSGSNLFHSFSTFNIDTGQTATFTSPAEVTNIISRVTGGSLSSIDGTIRSMLMDGSTLSSANLFLLNPSGVMFGPNARLDIGGSFHVSTADYLKFSDGGIFFANPDSSSVLSVASPEAFGFLSASPAPITADGAILQVPVGNTLSIIAGDISFSNDPSSETYFVYDPGYDFYFPGPTFFMLNAPGGTLNIVSVASPGEVNLASPDLGLASFPKLGNLTFANGANINVATDLFGSGPA